MKLKIVYKYLDIIFKPSGSFSEAINQSSKKACKALFFLYSQIIIIRKYECEFICQTI